MGYQSLARFDFPLQQRNLATTGARTATTLNSAYVHRTSGSGVSTRFCAGSNAGLSAAYIFLDTTTGTRANVSIRARLYEAATNNQPSATLVATSDPITYPAADDRWIVANFSSPPALSQGRLYYVCWDNTASAPATDFPGILTATNHGYNSLNALSAFGYVTTNGFSTAGSGVAEMPHMFTFTNGLSIGQPFTQQVNVFSSNTLWRGLWLPNSAKNYEWGMLLGLTTNTEVRVYRSDQLPADTPIFSQSVNADERLSQTIVFSTPLTLIGSTDFYLVVNSSSASNQPGHGQIEDYSSVSSVVDSMFSDGMGFAKGVQDNGANGWTLYDSAPAGITLIGTGNIVGGGGGGLKMFPGLNGGMDG